MKCIFRILCCCFTCIPLSAQETDTMAKIYTITDEDAEYAGGMAAMMQFICQNMEYPTCLMEPVSGRCYVQFVVRADGTIGEIKIQRSITDCPECDRAIVQVIRKMPPWKPAKLEGKPVASYYLLPVAFEFELQVKFGAVFKTDHGQRGMKGISQYGEKPIFHEIVYRQHHPCTQSL